MTCFGWKASQAVVPDSAGIVFDLCSHLEGGRRIPTIHSNEQIVEQLAGSSHDLSVDYALPSYQVSWHSALGRVYASEPHWIPMTLEEALAATSERETPPQSDDDEEQDDGGDDFLAKIKKTIGKTGASDMVSVTFVLFPAVARWFPPESSLREVILQIRSQTPMVIKSSWQTGSMPGRFTRDKNRASKF